MEEKLDLAGGSGYLSLCVGPANRKGRRVKIVAKATKDGDMIRVGDDAGSSAEEEVPRPKDDSAPMEGVKEATQGTVASSFSVYSYNRPLELTDSEQDEDSLDDRHEPGLSWETHEEEERLILSRTDTASLGLAERG